MEVANTMKKQNDNKNCAARVAYLLGAPLNRMKGALGYELDALISSGVFDTNAQTLRAACLIRSVLLKYFTKYQQYHETHTDLIQVLEGRYDQELSVIEEYNLLNVWQEEPYYESINLLTEIIESLKDVLTTVGIERPENIWKTYFELPKMDKRIFEQCEKTIFKHFKEYPMGVFIPKASKHGRWLSQRFFNDAQLYGGVELVLKKSSGYYKDFDVSEDYEGRVIHYLDGENNHPFHLLTVADTSPGTHTVKLFCETNTGIADMMDGRRCQVYEIKRVIKEKSQVDHALITTMALDEPDVVVLHSSDSDYLYSLQQLKQRRRIIVVCSKQSTSRKYLNTLEEIGIEIRMYDESSFDSNSVQRMVAAELNHTLKELAIAAWDVQKISIELARKFSVPVNQIQDAVSHKVKQIKVALNQILAE